MPPTHDPDLRLAAFTWLARLVETHGDVLSHAHLQSGFLFRGETVHIKAQKGIFKPRQCARVPLSIMTSDTGPYSDSFGPDNLLRYTYGPDERDNDGLRTAQATRTPLIYLHKIEKSTYLPAWPVFIVGDNPALRQFTVAVDEPRLHLTSADVAFAVGEADAEVRRRYITGTFRQRLHQRGFRERVLRAYQDRCALCRIRHRELLDAAHIIPDADDTGDPVVSNGLSLCKIHHAAFDRYFLTIRPDYIVEIRKDLLEEIDGPMLRHGLQELHGTRIVVPRRPDLRPDVARLERRYEAFRSHRA